MRVLGPFALLLALLAACCLCSAQVVVDEGDRIVQLISEKLRNGEDWQAVLAGEDKAVTSRKSGMKDLKRRMSAQKGARRGLGLFSGANTATRKNNKLLVKRQRPAPKSKANSMVIAQTELDSALQGPKQPNCAWQAYITGKQYNLATPDMQAVYQVLVMLKVNKNKIFRIRGKFPSTGNRYFSLQANNPDVGKPLTTIKDYEIVPDAGSGRNPYATDSDEPIGTYTIHVTPDGKQGLPNELALCPEGFDMRKCRSVNAVMLMRFYTSDPDLGPANAHLDPPNTEPNPRIWGYEDMAVVEERVGSRWRPFKGCDQTRPTAVTSIITDHIAKLIPPFPKPFRHNKKDNFVMYLSEEYAYSNLDAAYLLAIGHQGFITPGDTLLAKVTGVLPITARNVEKDPKIANWKDYEVRYASFSTIGVVEGGPTCDTVDDSAIIRFYKDKPDWAEHRAFSIAVGPSKTGPCMEELYDKDEDLFLSTSLKTGPVEYWGVLDRQLIPRAQHDGQADRSNGYAFKACSQMADNAACVDPAVLASLMGDYYPKITYYTCSPAGVLTPITEKLTAMLAPPAPKA